MSAQTSANFSEREGDNQLSGFTFLTYGDISSAAYNRAKLLGSELADQGFRIQYVVDKTLENVSNISWWASDKSEIIFVKRKPHIVGVLHRRIKLRKSIRNNLLIVQLNPHIKAFLSLIGLRSRIICEWDEPPIFRNGSNIEKYLSKFLHKWFLKQTEFKISCTKYFQSLNPEFAYIPHGYYLPISDRTPVIGNYAAYMGNLQSPWDHDLIFTGALSLASRGIKPEVHIIGSGIELDHWKCFCLENSLTNIHFLGRLGDLEMQVELENAKVLLNPMRDTLLNQTRGSSQLLAYAHSGRPVSAHIVGEVEELLGSFLVGVQVDEPIMDRLARFLNEVSPDLPPKIIDHSYKERASRFVRVLLN